MLALNLNCLDMLCVTYCILNTKWTVGSFPHFPVIGVGQVTSLYICRWIPVPLLLLNPRILCVLPCVRQPACCVCSLWQSFASHYDHVFDQSHLDLYYLFN